jgi:hypothetical protein
MHAPLYSKLDIYHYLFQKMPKKSGKKGKGKGKKKAKKTIAGAEDIVHSLLKCYERNCGLTESQMSPRIKSALRTCKENETVLSTVGLTATWYHE